MGQKKHKTTEEKKAKRINIFLIVFGCVALLAIVASIIVAIVTSVLSNRRLDYFGEDLSKYIYISEEDYKSFDVVNTVDKVTDKDVNILILQLLCENKGEAEYDGAYKRWPKISAGDELLIKYRGYTLDGDGNKVDFAGGCNFGDSDAAELEIGSGEFIGGFELGLSGKNAVDYAILSTDKTGTVQHGDFVMVSFTAMYPDGSIDQDVSVYLDLSSAATDKKYGEGFSEFFVGKTIGVGLEDSLVTELAEGSAIYTDITVNAAYRAGGDRPVLTVEAYFPYNYQEASLRSTTAYFDVYVMKGVEYSAPEFDDDFVSNTLKVTEESLVGYEGATLKDKYKAYLKQSLDEAYETSVKNLIEEVMWETYLEKVEVKKLPDFEVKAFYDDYVDQMISRYNTYGEMYGYSSLDDYATTYLSLDSDDDWQAELYRQAENAVLQKLIFHYICVREDFTLSDEEYDRRYAELVGEYLEGYLEQIGCEREDYDTDEEYADAVEKHKATMLTYYDDGFFEENIYYIFAMDKLSGFANLIEK